MEGYGVVMIVDAKSFSSGVDTATDPELSNYSNSGNVFTSVNRMFRGGINKTRPPFTVMSHTYENDEARAAFQLNAISGVFSYKKKLENRIPHLIAAAGEYILAGAVYANTIRWRVIYKGINMSQDKSYFCQADQFLIWGNGVDENLYWDGIANEMSTAASAIEGVEDAIPMPVVGPMVFAHGRIFGVSKNNLVFASNHIYSAGFDATQKGLFNFSESTYPSSGDGFGTPGDLGDVTGISVIKQGSQINGHGPVIVFCRDGAYAIGADLPRPVWTETRNIQTIAMTGRGCIGHFSIVQLNSDLWYRSSDGTVTSFKSAYSDFASQTSDAPLSSQVSEYLELDQTSASESSFGIRFDNRLLMSCAMIRSVRDNGQVDRYANGMVVADLYKAQQPYNISWDGIWTGLRFVGACSLQIDSMERAFFFSFDKDGKNRVYELQKGDGEDISESGESKIEWMFGNSFFFQPKDLYKTKEIAGLIVYFDGARDGSSVDAYYAPDTMDSITKMVGKDSGAIDICANAIAKQCAPHTYGNVYGSKAFLADCSSDFPAGGRRTVRSGNSFRIIIAGIGVMSIRKQLLFAHERDIVDLAKDSAFCGYFQVGDRCSEKDMVINYLIHK